MGEEHEIFIMIYNKTGKYNAYLPQKVIIEYTRNIFKTFDCNKSLLNNFIDDLLQSKV